MAPPADEAERTRRLILARRERLIAAALTGAGLSLSLTACDSSGPVCRSVRRGLPSISETVGCGYAGPCLSIAYVPPDGGAAPDAAASGRARDASDGGAVRDGATDGDAVKDGATDGAKRR